MAKVTHSRRVESPKEMIHHRGRDKNETLCVCCWNITPQVNDNMLTRHDAEIQIRNVISSTFITV